MMTPEIDVDDAIQPIETIAALVCMTVIVLFCLWWGASYLTGRSFVNSCVDGHGTAMISDAGKECVHHTAAKE